MSKTPMTYDDFKYHVERLEYAIGVVLEADRLEFLWRELKDMPGESLRHAMNTLCDTWQKGTFPPLGLIKKLAKDSSRNTGLQNWRKNKEIKSCTLAEALQDPKDKAAWDKLHPDIKSAVKAMGGE